MYQHTLAHSTVYTGIGLHSGQDVRLKLTPGTVDSGIVFYLHTDQGVRCLRPSPEVVSATALATTLSLPEDKSFRVSTVEHLLAALRGLEFDNVQVHVYGAEIPILDGSAAYFMELLGKAGRRNQGAPRRVAKITRPFSVAGEGKAIHAWPHEGFFVDYTIEFAHPSIAKQRLALEITPETFAEIANARTFGFFQEVEYLHSKGLALGGSLNNAVVLDEQGVINPEGLRCPDEFVRHKILDFVGDLAMLGTPLLGAFEVHCSGHNHNNVFLRRLTTEAHCLEYCQTVRRRSRPAPVEEDFLPGMAIPA